MALSHQSIRRYSTAIEGAFQNLKRFLIVIVSIPVNNSHEDFDAFAFDDLVSAIREFSQLDRSLTHVRLVYEMIYEEGLHSA